jgi:hypothetical protein
MTTLALPVIRFGPMMRGYDLAVKDPAQEHRREVHRIARAALADPKVEA